jgi:hypothetical protein
MPCLKQVHGTKDMTKIIVLGMVVLNQLGSFTLDSLESWKKFSHALQQVVLRACDDVDPGDEDHFE